MAALTSTVKLQQVVNPNIQENGIANYLECVNKKKDEIQRIIEFLESKVLTVRWAKLAKQNEILARTLTQRAKDLREYKHIIQYGQLRLRGETENDWRARSQSRIDQLTGNLLLLQGEIPRIENTAGYLKNKIIAVRTHIESLKQEELRYDVAIDVLLDRKKVCAESQLTGRPQPPAAPKMVKRRLNFDSL